MSAIARWLATLSPAELALRLVCLDLLLRPIGGTRLRVFFLGLAAAALLLPPLLRKPLLFWALAAAATLRVALGWPLADNHAYLLAYTCLAAALALGSAAPDETFARSARWLVALTFALATAWKVASPDFLDGRFFRVTLLRDGRMAAFAQLAGNLSPAEYHALAAQLVADEGGIAQVSAPTLDEPARLRSVARAAAVATVTLEAAVALAFLVPTGSRFARARHPLLLFFCITTYAIAPVEGFAWLLLALGVAQCSAGETRTRVLYVAAFALVLGYRELPWLDALVAVRDG